MMANLEQVVPGLAELREKERRNRALAFSGLTHTVCGVEVCPLTPKHRLQLQLLRNAFTAGATPLAGDVFVFLWVLSPAATWTTPGRKIVWNWLQWRLRRHVSRLGIEAAAKEIKDYIASQLQDMPEDRSVDGSPDYSNDLHWMGSEAGFWLHRHGGFTLQTYLATPYLVLQQLFRAYQVSNPPVVSGPDGKLTVDYPMFINGSDRMAGEFHRMWMKQIAEYHRAQHERRN